ncbi:acyl-homoserine-lactone synthase [Methylorubrum extorquens]|jgi:acyl-homoserine lactone synthase|uniref:Acyl-homoserine-lactone synthase n=1 Tax=Methylorubrum extorquens TaxID=408 RepID=A0AAX3WDN6_METEX|nr:acyl-homoserine-lactone synthase [Methylorubrum extorquens]KQO88547.1 autoinducer synthase [Methylobacterium sp. Leaf92]WHQ69717.1 GNAT family N-acetyltransferase [Methylorubrum extorquens]
MIHVVTAENMQDYADALDQAFRLRHRVFVEELGWSNLARPDRREIDEFDDEHAIHLLALDETESVIGYSRLLPTTRPYLLPMVLPQLCEGAAPSGAHIVEWGRICVAECARTSGRRLNPTALALMTAIVEWGLPRGITSFISEMPTSWILRLLQLHLRAMPLGLPHEIEGEEIVAVEAAFDGRSLRQLQNKRGDIRSVLAPPRVSFARLAS